VSFIVPLSAATRTLHIIKEPVAGNIPAPGIIQTRPAIEVVEAGASRRGRGDRHELGVDVAAGLAPEEPGVQPDIVVSDLNGLLDFVLDAPGAGE
jgi:hypothetical protein